MKYTAYIFKALFAIPVAASLTFSACSDTWDEHYNPEAQNQISGQSLWATIESNSELSNFASVLKAVGYDKSLAGSQAFSVFAPVNSEFSAEEAQALIDAYNTQKAAGVKDDENTTIKEFVKNHIALYNTSVSSQTNDSLTMMNGKYQILTSNTFSGKDLLTYNTACANGILYTLDGQATFSPNVYEYLSKDADLDSAANFITFFSEYEFDAANSVPGEIVDGKTVYLDSVTNLVNDEMHRYLGRIDSEDSTYWMVVPNNDIWNANVPQLEQYFVYDNTVSKRDSLQWAHARFALLRGTVFSRTTNPDAAINDSVLSTSAVSYNDRVAAWGNYDLKYYQYSKPFADGGVFNGTTNISCSNGQVMKASTWNFKPSDTYLQRLLFEGESSSRQDSVQTDTKQNPLAEVTTKSVSTSNPYYDKISNNRFAQWTLTGGTQARIYYSLPTDMLANVGYDIYVRMAPALAGDTLATDLERAPTKFRVYLRYQREDGTLSETTRNWTLLDGKNNTTSTSKAYFTTQKDSVDIIKIGNNIKIPYTTYGAGVSSKCELIFQTNVSNSELRNGTYNRILNIDEILVIPHEEK